MPSRSFPPVSFSTSMNPFEFRWQWWNIPPRITSEENRVKDWVVWVVRNLSLDELETLFSDDVNEK